MKRHFWLNRGIFFILATEVQHKFQLTNGFATVICHCQSSLMNMMMIMMMMLMMMRKPVEIFPAEDFAISTEAFLVQDKPAPFGNQ